MKLTTKEQEALYRILKEYKENAPDNEYYNDYYNDYIQPVSKKVINSILKKISSQLPKEIKKEIDKDFLRRKYHPFNNEINERAYSVIEKGFSQNRTVEIKYFNMKRAEFIKRKINVYYKSRRYVIAYCHLRKAIRKFRASRIASAKLTDKKYKIPRDFDKNKY